MISTATGKAYSASGVAKLVMKKTKTIKSEHIVLDNITHMEFIRNYSGYHHKHTGVLLCLVDLKWSNEE